MNNDLDQIAHEVYELAMTNSFKLTPRSIEGDLEREIWQTKHIDDLFNKAFGTETLAPRSIAMKLRMKIKGLSAEELSSVLQTMQEWNHEHELEEQPIYVLNPDHQK